MLYEVITLASERWEQLTIDVMSMPSSAEGYNCILACIDTLTRFAIAIPLKNQTAESQIEALQERVYCWGTPSVLICDRHPVYHSDRFLNFLAMKGTSVFMGPGYSSTHVALVNRLHCIV